MTYILSEDSVFRLFNAGHDINQRKDIYVVENFYDQLRTKLGKVDPEESRDDWFQGSVGCEILYGDKENQEWINAQVRIRIEFLPNESDKLSSEIRRNQDWNEVQDSDTIYLEDIKCALGMQKNMFIKRELVDFLRSRFSITDINYYRYAWFGHGVPCQTLFLGKNASKGWIDGRIRLRIEFNPDISQISRT